MKSKKVLLLMAALTAMTVSGCGKKDEVPADGTEIAAIMDAEQPTEAIPTEAEGTEDIEEQQIEAVVTDTEEVTTSQADSSIKEMSATKYAKSTVNVRKGPSADSEKIGGLSTNQKVTVTGQAENGWYRIDFNGEAGYVSDKYLVDEKVTTASTDTKTDNTGAAENTGNEAPAQENAGTQTAGNTASSGNNGGNTASSGSSDSGNTTGNEAPAQNNTGSEHYPGEVVYDNESSGTIVPAEDAQWFIDNGVLENGGILNPDGSITLP